MTSRRNMSKYSAYAVNVLSVMLDGSLRSPRGCSQCLGSEPPLILDGQRKDTPISLATTHTFLSHHITVIHHCLVIDVHIY